MSGDEVLVTVASVVIGPIAWIWWLADARGILAFRPAGRSPLNSVVAVLLLCTALIAAVLSTLAADDVRDAPQYLFQYLMMGVAWTRVASFVYPLLGLNPRDDLLERLNRAAVPAWSGAMVGVTCCYAGGNIGNGPGWWVVVFSGGLASLALGAVWLLVGQSTKLVDAVVVGRDLAAGWRLGGLLTAAGVVFGAAVAGDWVSVEATVADFVWRAAPIVALVAGAIVMERVLQPAPDRPAPPIVSSGIAPAAAYLAIAASIVAYGWGR